MGGKAMFEAVIFDFGGVITESPFEAFNRMEARLGISPNTVRRINATNPDTNAWALFERSEIGPEEFDRRFSEEAAALGVTLAGRDVLSCLHGSVRPRMLEALKRIAGKFRTGCITNNVKAAGPDHSNRDAKVAEAFSLFGHVLESSKIGIRKPDPRIYTMMLEALSVKPERAVYLDDLGINLKPAKALGMTTIKVVTGDDAIAELERHLGMKLG
jgi:putative hydrolase of the HAD superfamily